MTDATREWLKKFGEKKPLQTAILTTPDYDRGLAEGRRQGIDDCIVRMKDLFKIIANGEQDFVLKELEKLKNG